MRKLKEIESKLNIVYTDNNEDGVNGETQGKTKPLYEITLYTDQIALLKEELAKAYAREQAHLEIIKNLSRNGN